MQTTRYVFVAVLGLIALVTPRMARADSIVVFDASGTLTGGTSLSGTVTIDTTAGTLIGTNLATTGTVSIPSFTLVPFLITNYNGTGLDLIQVSDTTTADILSISIPVTTLIGYPGGPLCGLSTLMYCGSGGAGYAGVLAFQPGPQIASIESGTLVPSPEPSTVFMLGAGLLGLVVARKQKWIT